VSPFSLHSCLLLVQSCFSSISFAYAQGAKQTVPGMPIASAERDHVKERSAWFLSGRVVAAKPSAELRRRAYEKKMQWRSQRNNAAAALTVAPGPTGSSFPGAVTLSCPSGLPAGAQCLFSPSTPIVPGSTSAGVVMSISTPTTARLQGPYNRNPIFLAMWLALPGMVVLFGTARGRPDVVAECWALLRGCSHCC
jgi:hypothetical protein